MKTDVRDYLYSLGLSGLILSAAILLTASVQDWLTPLMGPYSAIGLFFLFALAYGGLTAISLALLAVVLPLRPGNYDTDDPQFTLWKVQHVVGELSKLALRLFFPVFMRQAFYALFGACVGKNVAVAGTILDPRLTTLEDRCVLGEGCVVTSHALSNDRFILRRVCVCRDATVGAGCIIMPGVTVGPGAVVLPGSVLKAGTEVPADETWGGIPAQRIRTATTGSRSPVFTSKTQKTG